MKVKWVSRDSYTDDLWLWDTRRKPQRDRHGAWKADDAPLDTIDVFIFTALGFRVPAEGECIKLERIDQ